MLTQVPSGTIARVVRPRGRLRLFRDAPFLIAEIESPTKSLVVLIPPGGLKVRDGHVQNASTYVLIVGVTFVVGIVAFSMVGSVGQLDWKLWLTDPLYLSVLFVALVSIPLVWLATFRRTLELKVRAHDGDVAIHIPRSEMLNIKSEISSFESGEIEDNLSTVLAVERSGFRLLIDAILQCVLLLMFSGLIFAATQSYVWSLTVLLIGMSLVGLGAALGYKRFRKLNPRLRAALRNTFLRNDTEAIRFLEQNLREQPSVTDIELLALLSIRNGRSKHLGEILDRCDGNLPPHLCLLRASLNLSRRVPHS